MTQMKQAVLGFELEIDLTRVVPREPLKPLKPLDPLELVAQMIGFEPEPMAIRRPETTSGGWRLGSHEPQLIGLGER